MTNNQYNAMLEDDNLLMEFIKASEQSLHSAPSGFTDSVMRAVNSRNQTIVTVTVPVLSRKMCAAVCFSSAAAILLLTVFGIDRQFSDFILTNSGKLTELLTTLKIL